jgi:NADH-quinone oxidoreductase subunit L
MIEKLASLMVLVPVLPLLAAAVIAVTKRPQRRRAAGLAIGAMALSCLISVLAFFAIASAPEERLVRNLDWLQFGDITIQLGWMLDPLSAAMAAMVSFVGLLIFIFSVGYMAHDENFTRFFGFLALFGAAMLGLVIANSLLLLFICWELVGLASYLLIGFWFHKPEAAAAAKKAFITTRVGDMGLLLGMVWLHAATGTLTFYDGGQGCLEAGALDSLGAAGMAARLVAPATLIALLLFCGAAGKSGQVPLHVWLPDAMEGPTPVSALIHAATMVAAGVFLMARVYPLLAVGAAPGDAHSVVTPALTVITWVGAFTALFAAFIAVAQNDIKRILAYSTVSQLGYMFLGLGTGGVAVGMFHLLTHAFFKALLFLGAGSVIHGCHEEQDIRYMGGVRRWMPLTFATYAVGMMALSGVPLFFSGFWSKDEILHAAHGWPVSHIPFLMGSLGAVLTAFYMTRQMFYVFFGPQRSREGAASGKAADHPHESPRVMTTPLVILAVFAVVLGIFGTPAWPWAQSFLEGEHAHVDLGHLFSGDVLAVMGISLLCVAAGIGGGWWLYGRKPIESAARPDVLEERAAPVFVALKNRLYVDELYEATVIRFNALAARCFDILDRWILGGAVLFIGYLVVAFAWVGRFLEDNGINAGFDGSCRGIRRGAGAGAALQDGRVHNYLRALGIGFAMLLLLMTWGCHS